MKYYNLNGKLPHITYEYTIPRTSHDITAAEDVAGPSQPRLNLTYNEVNEGVGGDHLRATNGSVTSVHHYNSQLGAGDQSDVQLQDKKEEEVIWPIRTPSPPPPAGVLVYRPPDVTTHVFGLNDVERGPPVPAGYRESHMHLSSGSASVPCNVSLGRTRTLK